MYQGARKMKSCLGLKFAVFVLFLSHIECSFRCGYRYSLLAGAWFKHSETPATWSDARLRCSLEGATLASPTTPEIRAEMTHTIQNVFSPGTEVFTGIHATFSQSDYATVEGTPVNKYSLSWARNEPNNLNNNERCITMNCHGDFADRPCSETRPYICYRSHDLDQKVNECGNFDPEYKLSKRTNSCYKFHSTKRTFSEASSTCSAEGGHLAVINSETEASVIRWLLIKNPAKDINDWFRLRVVFIGFTDWNRRGNWRTIHGQTLEEAGYSKFSLGEPNNYKGRGEYCGSVYFTSLLNDASCDTPREFICETNPNDPTVCNDRIELVSNVEIWNTYKK